MATLKEAIVEILSTDDTLRALLGYNASTKPNVVVYQYPREQITPPYLTYRISGETGFKPREVFLDILAWADDLKAIHNRVFELLHQRQQVTATDWQVKGILFESSGPELYDENLKVYFQRARYRVVCWKI